MRLNRQVLALYVPIALLILHPHITSCERPSRGSALDHELQPRKAPALPTEPPVSTHPSHPISSKAGIGTKDAPVDGLDGKPHAGPFVDPAPDSRNGGKVNGYEHYVYGAGKQAPEDSVMNDPNRFLPKHGSTGTEGGVSEKERIRTQQELEIGERVPKKPAPPSSSLKERQDAAEDLSDSVSTSETSIEKGKETVAEKVKGIAGLEKPTDLPQRPSGYGTPKEMDDDDEHDTDDEDSDFFEEDGPHDFIPWDSLAGSFSSIAASEIGDKTFIVAALMAMRHSRAQVFTAAFSALFIMTILSGVAGHTVGAIISKKWSAVVAAILFLVFGARSLREGFEMSPDQGVSDEIREVEAELEEKEEDMARQSDGHGPQSSISPYALEAGRGPDTRRSRSMSRLAAPKRSPSSTSRSPAPSQLSISDALSGIKNLFLLLLSPTWVETFSMTFVGELGDRSQIATVAMAAGQEYFWVMVGASLGHFVCTGVAVLGGSVLAGRVSLRKVTLVGGGIFIAFGIFTLIEAVQYWL